MDSRIPPSETPDCPDPSELLSITIEPNSGSTVVVARGEVDLYTAPLLRSALHEAIDGSAECVVIDLADVTFMASSGLATLLAGLDHAQRRRCELRLAGGGRAVRRPLQATGLDATFNHYPSAAAAIRDWTRARLEMVITAGTAPSTDTP
ncbi:MAG TPA: STAS domain-containing protein [Pseudonocardiaceae bacterium]|jgi:anti-sigma B factor antagonist